MTTSPPASRSPVRQQLDELDALLQRMLSLPHNSGEPTPLPERAPPPITLRDRAPASRTAVADIARRLEAAGHDAARRFRPRRAAADARAPAGIRRGASI